MMFVWGVTDVLQMMGPQFGGVCVGCYRCPPDYGALVDGVCVGCYRCSPDDGASV